MRRLVVVWLLLAAGHPAAQQPDALRAAIDTMGAARMTSLRFAGSGAAFSVGQSTSPREAWPRVTVKSLDVTVDYSAPAMRTDITRDRGAVVEFVNGTDAWDVRAQAPAPQPQPQLATERMLQIWLTPHGFLKGALANFATSRTVPEGTEVSYTVQPGHRIVGLINAQNQVERVRTWIGNPVLGDMPIEVTYRDYKDVGGGIQFPTRIIQTQGGHPSLDLTIASVEANAKADMTAPEAVRGATSPPVRVNTERIADGVYWLTGGSHHSVAIEMRDHVIVVEAPLDEPRSLVVIAAVHEAIPNKPIRFVVNTHPHFDHAGGLRTFVADGATVVTHEMNRAFYETAWAGRRGLNPDRLAQSGGKAAFQAFTDKHVLTDGARTVEVHRIAGSPHHDGFAMVYLPAEKLLIEADAYTPAAASAPAPPASPTAVNFYDNIGRLKLDVARIVPLHGPRVATLEEFAKGIGR